MTMVYTAVEPAAGTLPPLVVALAAGFDGDQWLSDPDGTRAPSELPASPTNLTALSATAGSVTVGWAYNATGHDGFLVQYWRSGTDNAWQTAGTHPPAARSAFIPGLPPSTDIGVRVTAYNANGSSTPPAEVWAYTLAPSTGALPTFADRTHTVSASATGQGDGTDADPWTLKQALHNCQPGMIIGVRAGVYVGERAMGYVNEEGQQNRQVAWHPRNSGTVDAPIVLVAEHWATHTEDRSLYSDLRSGATRVLYGWPVFGQLGYGSRPKMDYITWIGFFSDEHDSNNKLWGGGDHANSYGETTMSGCWGRGDHCKFFHCRLIRSNDIELAGNDFDNKSHFRIEQCTDVEVADCHLTVLGCSQINNNTHFTMYQCQYLDVHHSYMTSDTGAGMAWHIKGGISRGIPFKGLQFHHNRVENVRYATRMSGPEDEPVEFDRVHVYSNLFIGGRSPFTWTTSDGIYRLNGLRWYNNTRILASTSGESSSFELEGRHQDEPQLNPRQVSFYNNIAAGGGQYMMTNYSTKHLPGTQYVSDFLVADYNCTTAPKPFRAASGDALNSATWEQWQATNYLGRASDGNGLKVADIKFAETQNYTLRSDSPCKGLGRDVYGRYGPVGAVIDAGCYAVPGDVVGIRV